MCRRCAVALPSAHIWHYLLEEVAACVPVIVRNRLQVLIADPLQGRLVLRVGSPRILEDGGRGAARVSEADDWPLLFKVVVHLPKPGAGHAALHMGVGVGMGNGLERGHGHGHGLLLR